MANIWLIDHYVTTPATGIGGRHFQMARALGKRGHNVTVIAARKHHMLREGTDANELPHIEHFDGFDFVRIDVPRYAGAHDKKRILAWVGFAVGLWMKKECIKPRPDAILYVWPQPFAATIAFMISRKFGARFILEVRDIWPLTLIHIGKYSEKHPFIRFLKWLERWIVTRADQVVSNLEGAEEHLASLGMDRGRFCWLANGITLEDVSKPSPLPARIEEELPQTGLRLAYTGTLGSANALETVIDALGLLRDLQDVSLVVAGEGKLRVELEQRCKALGLENIHFIGALNKSQVQTLLRYADACYIGWKDVPLYRWGIGANKLPEYFYSERPVLHSYSGAFDPVARYDAGITVPAEDPEALANAIRELRNMPIERRRAMGERGRAAALTHYNYATLAVRLEGILSGRQSDHADNQAQAIDS